MDGKILSFLPNTGRTVIITVQNHFTLFMVVQNHVYQTLLYNSNIYIYIFIIYLFIYCNWVVTRWQWLFYMFAKYEIGY